MRAPEQILRDQSQELEWYRQSYGQLTPDEIAEHNNRMTALRDEMRLVQIEGAIVHPFIEEWAAAQEPSVSGHDLIWAHHTSHNKFFIACEVGGVLYRAHGFDRESALKNWNNQHWYVKPETAENQA